MHPDDEAQTTLSKWPFILGDVLLVGTALAIAILGGWQLTNWQVAACVAAVALGAALFVLPYVVEFQVRVREEREDRAADLRVLERHILAAGQTLSEADTRLRALERAAAESGHDVAALGENTHEKLAQLEAARAAQEESIQGLREQLKELPQDAPAAFDPALLKPLEQRLADLEARATASGPSAEALPSQATAEAPAPPPAPEAAVTPKKTVTQIDRPQRAARERHGPRESRLLQRAISENSDHSSAAVSRIIEFKAQAQKAAEPAEPVEQPTDEPVKQPVEPNEPLVLAETVEPAEPTEAVEPAEPEEPAEPAEPEEPAEPAEPRIEVAKKAPEDSIGPEPGPATPELETDSAEKPLPADPPTAPVKQQEHLEAESAVEPPATMQKSTPPEPLEEGEPDTVNPAAEGLDTLLEEAATTGSVPRTKAKKNDTVLTAAVFIGIGNKPYLRGSGGGLNWEQGVAMEFQEIGKWQWIAPADLESTLDVQIFRNDEDPDRSGKYTLEPGQKLEVQPVF